MATPPTIGDWVDMTLSQAQPWISECLSKHNQCRLTTPTKIPTRLIDIGPPDGSKKPFLFVPSSTNFIPAKCEKPWAPTPDTTFRYLALSYCWGDTGNLVTTPENIDARRVAIPGAEMPETIKDAICVTRKLGFRYLWVDALCIIQGPGGDWATESAKMEEVYSGAFLTISAALSRHVLSKYTASSWSWASTKCHIKHYGLVQWRVIAKVIDARIELKDPLAPFGEVVSGSIVLCGPLLPFNEMNVEDIEVFNAWVVREHGIKFTRTTIFRVLIPISSIKHIPDLTPATTWGHDPFGQFYGSFAEDESEMRERGEEGMSEITARKSSKITTPLGLNKYRQVLKPGIASGFNPLRRSQQDSEVIGYSAPDDTMVPPNPENTAPLIVETSGEFDQVTVNMWYYSLNPFKIPATHAIA
ncbi:hypothetical protein G7Y89_g5277 [Cudoniella acicularis]|uniref:Heterokaryon incompatibility domain-containing protein n=1 Tax=Cudoniella acicularis TaxID=354080 RepID=A0A8H4RP59_9HELO|nr:hypothetical protein G7Y89_g5277 [Cudoniella acicularis]